MEKCTLFVFRLLFSFILCRVSSAVIIKNNAYKEIVISFSPGVIPNESFNLKKLQKIFQTSSEYLFHATKNRAYFSEFIFVLPDSGSNLCTSLELSRTLPSDVSVYVTDSNPAMPTLKTQHSRGCGEPGEVIYMPISWLQEGNVEDLSRQFVQQWATYRYGVFEETPASNLSCFTTDGEFWAPAGCYGADIKEKLDLDERGLPICNPLNDVSSYAEIRSSIMFNTDSPNVTDFCDGSITFPHNPLVPTRHNTLCQGRPVWRVIQNTEDFKYGKNPTLDDTSFRSPVKFKCFQDVKPHLFIAVQSSSTTDITGIVNEMRFSLLHFFLYDVSSDTAITIFAFSDQVQTAKSNPVSLNLKIPQEVITNLTSSIRTASTVKNVCLVCGLRKILNASRVSGDPSVVVTFIALSSAFQSENLPEFLKEIEDSSERVNIIVIQDTTIDPIPASLVDALHKKGGQVFALPNITAVMYVKLNMVLVTLVKRPLHIEEEIVIVHQQTYFNITEDITDTFTTDGGLEGTLIYIVNCNEIGPRLEQYDSNCSPLLYLIGIGSSHKCGEITELKSFQNSTRWEYKFKYLSGISSLTCASLATLRLKRGHHNSLTVRGWLSHHTIQPGQDALIIYAEVLKDYVPMENVLVQAFIYRPSLESSEPVRLILNDNGNGDPDVKNADGIYSRYFTEFSERGMYSVVIQATTKNKVEKSDDVDPKPFTFFRVTAIGSFSLVGETPIMDIYPPNRVGDLKAIGVDHENSTVTLQWTAPGDDYDSGKTSKYIVKYATTWTNLLELSFESTNTPQLVSIHGELKPLASGRTEEHTFQFPLVPNNITYYIALKANDREENHSPISNIIQVYVKETKGSKEPAKSTGLEFLTSSSSANFTQPENENYTNNPIQSTSDLIDKHTELNSSTASIVPTAETTIGNNTAEHGDIKHFIVMTSSIGGGVLLLIILINILICVCCIRKRKKEPPLSRKASLRPPHNMSISYKPYSTNIRPEGSVESLQDALVENSVYSEFQISEHDNAYEYPGVNQKIKTSHLNADRIRPKNNEDDRNNFRLVRATPAYATASLASHSQTPTHNQQFIEMDSVERQSPSFQRSQRDDRTLRVQDAHIYPLGVV